MPPRGIEAWLSLWRCEGMKPALFLRLLEKLGDPDAVLRATPATWRQMDIGEPLRSAVGNLDHSGVASDLAWLEERPDRCILTWNDPLYPPRLRQIAQAPPVLFVQGDSACLSDPQVAIVGTRNPTAVGRRNAHDLAAELARAGLVVTSGLALGIDAAAHEGALSASGATIAVAAHGLDRLYPTAHGALKDRIIGSGAWISEFPIGVPARPEHFPRRNRIISGLAVGVVVVEAALRSGSLITARYALDQGRNLMAMPGSIHNPVSAGCHHLIREGAVLIESGQQVLEELYGQLTPQTEPVTPSRMTSEGLDAVQHKLLCQMEYEPCMVEELVQRSGLTPAAVSSMLLTLELKGYVAADRGGRYSRLGKVR